MINQTESNFAEMSCELNLSASVLIELEYSFIPVLMLGGEVVWEEGRWGGVTVLALGALW